MKAEMTAMVLNGILKPDSALPFADQTRVELTIEPVETQGSAVAAWTRLKQRIDEHAIAGLAGCFSREALYERD
jgi:hypothetical protein